MRHHLFTNTNFPYYMEYPSDPSPIDIAKLIDFYDRIYLIARKEDVARSIRDFAEIHVDMKRVMEPIYEYIVN